MSSLNSFSALKSFTNSLPVTGKVMPALFIGHGSPMNGIEDNEFSQTWSAMPGSIPIPKAVIVISAHWLTNGTRITAMPFPKTIHDFGGFPESLYQVQYPVRGNPSLAQEVKELVKNAVVELNHDWGLDHGAWTVVRHMYPDASIPVLQISIDYTKNMQFHYDLARELVALRKKGILVIGSGNLVHNLKLVAWDKLSLLDYSYDWAAEISTRLKKLILNNDHTQLINYSSLGKEALMAIPTPDHYIPLLYTLGLQDPNEPISLFNDKAVGGSITMTSVKIG
jgi:4,5-DOPA dioxygenase extradiol